MNIKELREAMEGLPDDMPVWLQVDEEGNGYNALRVCDPECVMVDGDCYSMDWDADDADMSPEKWESIKALPRSLVLSP